MECVINEYGSFQKEGLDRFAKANGILDCEQSYAVVAIMGPQSSGKSTLLNGVFGTKFLQMIAGSGRKKTTKGVNISRAPNNIMPRCTLVLDLEGTDGIERQDSTAFENQTAHFALAVADIVIINMWYFEIGRDKAANVPLLSNVFQIFKTSLRRTRSDSSGARRKTTLLIAIHDKMRSKSKEESDRQFKELDRQVREGYKKIWETVTVTKSSTTADKLEDYFNIEVRAFSHYEFEFEAFKKEVADLRVSIIKTTGNHQAVVHGSCFTKFSYLVWEKITLNNFVDLEAIQDQAGIEFATSRCKQIQETIVLKFKSSKEWIEISESVTTGTKFSGWGKKTTGLLKVYFDRYDEETLQFDGNIRAEIRAFHRHVLEMEVQKIILLIYRQIVEKLHEQALATFKKTLADSSSTKAIWQSKTKILATFDEGITDWVDCVREESFEREASTFREKIRSEMHTLTAEVQKKQIHVVVSGQKSAMENFVKEIMTTSISSSQSVTSTQNTWSHIRILLAQEVEHEQTSLRRLFSGYELDESMQNFYLDELDTFARDFVIKEARKYAAQTLLKIMLERFKKDFHGSNTPTDQGDPIYAITMVEKNALEARSLALYILSVFTVVRLDEAMLKPNRVDHLLATLLLRNTQLTVSTWGGISPELILLTPHQCSTIWSQFMNETEVIVQQAREAGTLQRYSSNAVWLRGGERVDGYSSQMISESHQITRQGSVTEKAMGQSFLPESTSHGDASTLQAQQAPSANLFSIAGTESPSTHDTMDSPGPVTGPSNPSSATRNLLQDFFPLAAGFGGFSSSFTDTYT